MPKYTASAEAIAFTDFFDIYMGSNSGEFTFTDNKGTEGTVCIDDCGFIIESDWATGIDTLPEEVINHFNVTGYMYVGLGVSL